MRPRKLRMPTADQDLSLLITTWKCALLLFVVLLAGCDHSSGFDSGANSGKGDQGRNDTARVTVPENVKKAALDALGFHKAITTRIPETTHGRIGRWEKVLTQCGYVRNPDPPQNNSRIPNAANMTRQPTEKCKGLLNIEKGFAGSWMVFRIGRRNLTEITKVEHQDLIEGRETWSFVLSYTIESTMPELPSPKKTFKGRATVSLNPTTEKWELYRNGSDVSKDYASRLMDADSGEFNQFVQPLLQKNAAQQESKCDVSGEWLFHSQNEFHMMVKIKQDGFKLKCMCLVSDPDHDQYSGNGDISGFRIKLHGVTNITTLAGVVDPGGNRIEGTDSQWVMRRIPKESETPDLSGLWLVTYSDKDASGKIKNGSYIAKFSQTGFRLHGKIQLPADGNAPKQVTASTLSGWVFGREIIFKESQSYLYTGSRTAGSSKYTGKGQFTKNFQVMSAGIWAMERLPENSQR